MTFESYRPPVPSRKLWVPTKPPITRNNTAEGGTNGVVITPGNSGGASGDAFTNVRSTPKFSNLHPLGTMSVDLGDVTTTRYGVGWDESWGKTVYGRCYLYFDKGVVDNIYLEPWIVFGSSWSPYATIYTNEVSPLDLRDSLNVFAGSGTLVPKANTLYRYEWKTVSHASAGSIEVRIYWGHELTPLDTVSATGLNGDGSDLTTIAYGHESGTVGTHVLLDDLGASTVDWMGPTGVPASLPVTRHERLHLPSRDIDAWGLVYR